jgi:hypothetical protein
VKWTLHHENAPSHIALSIREFLANKSTVALEHPAYPSDFALCESFPTTKNYLSGSHLEAMEEIKKVVTVIVNS